jgi:Fe-S cluster biosynthesis and repair protein YggX
MVEQYEDEVLALQRVMALQKPSSKEQHERSPHEQSCTHPRNGDFPVKIPVLNRKIQAEISEEAQCQISELETRLLECQKRIGMMQEEQDVLLQQEMRN